MNSYKKIHDYLLHIADPIHEKQRQLFFKRGKGQYAEHDCFLGIVVPQLRRIAKLYRKVAFDVCLSLLQSSFNEERLLGLFILVDHYNKGNALDKKAIFMLYTENLNFINNWNLVDSSAHFIIGAHLFDQEDKSYLMELSLSPNLWHRRIGIISTFFFIRKNQYQWTIKLAELLLHDKHDLIHKAVGWMLREMGQKEEQYLKNFLDLHAKSMPRTMLRYSIEKLPTEERKMYMNLKVVSLN